MIQEKNGHRIQEFWLHHAMILTLTAKYSDVPCFLLMSYFTKSHAVVKTQILARKYTLLIFLTTN